VVASHQSTTATKTDGTLLHTGKDTFGHMALEGICNTEFEYTQTKVSLPCWTFHVLAEKVLAARVTLDAPSSTWMKDLESGCLGFYESDGTCSRFVPEEQIQMVLNTIHEGGHKLLKKIVMDQLNGSAGVDGDKRFFAQYHFCPAASIGHTFLEPSSPKLVVLRFTSQAIELEAPDDLKSHIRRCLPWLPNDMSQINPATSHGGHDWKTVMRTEWSVMEFTSFL
jgi:hypothetical protein